jgi:hypothetical protein
MVILKMLTACWRIKRYFCQPATSAASIRLSSYPSIPSDLEKIAAIMGF